MFVTASQSGHDKTRHSTALKLCIRLLTLPSLQARYDGLSAQQCRSLQPLSTIRHSPPLSRCDIHRQRWRGPISSKCWFHRPQHRRSSRLLAQHLCAEVSYRIFEVYFFGNRYSVVTPKRCSVTVEEVPIWIWCPK